MSGDCKHEDFKANVSVGRLTASESDDTVIGYSADVTIECANCGKPFEFVGLPMGYSPMQPMVSVNGQEARMPIMPEGEQMRTDLAGFAIRRIA